MDTTIDKAGRVVVPKAMRDQLGLSAGSQVHITLQNGTIEIAPKRPRIELVEDPDGYLVLHAPVGTPAMTDDDVRTMIDVSRRWPRED